MTTTAAAPSEICDADPAVTVPSGENAGRSLARLAAVVPGRTPSSAETVSGSPRRCGTVTSTISSSNRPFLPAAVARSWLIAEYSSWLTTIGSPLRCGIETGTTSSSKTPFFHASAAFWCEAAANSSCSSRVSLMPSALACSVSPPIACCVAWS